MRSNRKIIFGLLLILGAVLFYRVFLALSGSKKPVPSVATGNTPANGDPNLRAAAYKSGAGRVAKTRMDIPANTIVTPDMLQMVSNPSTEGYITDIDSQGSGFVTRVDIPANTPIRPQYDFVGHVSEVGIAGLLRPGTRAMVIPIANKPTLHELVRIGNSVDIIAAYDGQESRTLIQDVRVLGVDLSGNDYPNVNVAMRGPFKAEPKQNGVRNADPAAAPTVAPTVAPNAPRPDPAITLEVTPVQASRLQLALASSATLDYLIRPALPGNRSAEVAPNPADVNNPNGQVSVQTISVTKRQIAPYAESRKAAGGGGSTRAANTGGSNGGRGGGAAPIYPRGSAGRPPQYIGDQFPPSNNSGTGMGVPPLPLPVAGPTSKPVPTPTQNYAIPIYGDGKISRTEIVPLPDPSR